MDLVHVKPGLKGTSLWKADMQETTSTLIIRRTLEEMKLRRTALAGEGRSVGILRFTLMRYQLQVMPLPTTSC